MNKVVNVTNFYPDYIFNYDLKSLKISYGPKYLKNVKI